MIEKKPTNLKELLEKIKKMNGCRKNVNCSDQACIDCAGYWVVELEQSRREIINIFNVEYEKIWGGDCDLDKYEQNLEKSHELLKRLLKENLDFIGEGK